MTVKTADSGYGSGHVAPTGPEDGAPMHDIESVLPDVHEHPEYYRYGSPGEDESLHHIRRVRNNPEAKVRIYRALPAEHAHKGFQPGDWVTLSKDYARQHGTQEHPHDDWPVIRATVRAGELWNEGYPTEFGYSGPAKGGMISYKGGRNQEVAHHADGVIRPVKRRPPKQAALSDEDRVSVAEQVMHRSRLHGETFHVPQASFANAPEGVEPFEHQRKLSEAAEGFVNGVLQSKGHPGGIRVVPSHWGLREPGSGQAVTDGMNYIGLAGTRTNKMELLHEVAHILHGEPETGHGPDYQRTVHGLYHEHLGPGAADTFAHIVWPHEARLRPTQRIFGPTYGLDRRLWSPDGTLKPELRSYILGTVNQMWGGKYRDWSKWARVYFAGSEASLWTGPDQVGNGDLDVLIGVDYKAFRKANPAYRHLSSGAITTEMNRGFRAFNGPVVLTVDGEPVPLDRTTYVNADSYDIRRIRPYAAYNVGADEWAVKPPELPDWSLASFPKPVVKALIAAESYARDVLRLPEPQRTQQGAALFDSWHSDRSRAFSEHGEGWWDFANLREKWLDQVGVWKQLVDAKHRDDQGLAMGPADWSNMPVYAAYAGDHVFRHHPPHGDRAFQHVHTLEAWSPEQADSDWARAAPHDRASYEGSSFDPGYRPAGSLSWDRESGEIKGVYSVVKRQGLATELLRRSREMARTHPGIPEPVHSDFRSGSGDAWARSTGEELPPRKQAIGPSRLARAWGSNDENTLFGEAPVTAVPWPRAGRLKRRQDYDPELVRNMITSPEHHHMQDVDPRSLHATQPGLTRAGVRHYLGDRYQRTGETYAEMGNPGNRRPVVYRREDGENLLLSGHHRAAAALLRGRPLQALVVDGPWGPER